MDVGGGFGDCDRGKIAWRVEDVIKSGSLRVLKNGGEEFSCECEATIIKRRDVSVSA